MKLSDFAAEYVQLFADADITSPSEATAIVRHIVLNKPHYQSVEADTHVPWWVVGIIHSLEADLRFDTHLFNGDPLTARTVEVPKGRPLDGEPPFQWEFSAVRSLQYDHLDLWTEWDVAGTLFMFERYNGFGYREHGIHSPYLWAGSNHYIKGKFDEDGHFNPDEKSQEIGAAVLLKVLLAGQSIALPAEAISHEGTEPQSL